MMWMAVALLAWAALPARAQLYYGGGGVGSPVYPPQSGTFNQRFDHRGFKPGFPYAYGYWGTNPYIGYYYGFNGYGVPYYPPPYYPSMDYYAPPAAAYSESPPPAPRDDYRLPPPSRLPPPEPNVAYIDLHVPVDATLWAQGVQMASKGTTRRFVSPPLEPGYNYSYEFRIRYQENGKDVDLVRHISVAAGDRKSLTIVEGTASK